MSKAIDELIAIELKKRQAKRKKAKEIGDLQQAKIGEELKGAGKAALLTAPQGVLLGGADELIGMFDEEAGQQYRKAVEAARDEYPISTLLAEEGASALALGALGKVAKFLRSGKKASKADEVDEIFEGLGDLANPDPTKTEKLKMVTMDKLESAKDAILDAPSTVLPPGGIPRTVATGATQGALEAEEGNRGMGALATGTFGAGFHAGGRAVKRAFDDPKAQLARYFGVTGTGFRQKGSQEMVENISNLHDMGAFSMREVKFVPAKEVKGKLTPSKFVNVKGGKIVPRKRAKEVFRERLNDTIKTLDNENKRILKNSVSRFKNFGIDEDDVNKELAEKIRPLYEASDDPDNFLWAFSKRLETLRKGISYKTKVSQLVDMRRELQSKADSVYKAQRTGNAVPNNQSVDAKISEVLASWMNTLIEKNAGKFSGGALGKVQYPAMAKKIARNNAEMSRMIRVRNQLDEAISSDRAKENNLSYIYGKMDAMQKGARGLSERVISPFRKSGIGKQMGDLMDEGTRQGAEDFIRGLGTRQGERWMSPMIDQQGEGRSPQSVNVNPMVDDTLLERDSDWIMKHPNMVQAKLLKEAPEMAAQVALAIAKGPSTVKKIMPQIANMMPHLFEDSDYGMFDGKIIDPNDKARYIDKVMNDSNLSSLEKAEMIDHLNRTNEVIQ